MAHHFALGLGGMRLSLATIALAGVAIAACSATEGHDTPPGGGGATATTSTSDTTSGSGGGDFDGGTEPGCLCAPGAHDHLIYVASQYGEIFGYDPADNTFTLITQLSCGASTDAFSMAVDREGLAWILLVDSYDIVTLDLNAPSAGGCLDPGYAPGGAGFGLFGMAFTGEDEASGCARLYGHSYSGDGAFSEGPGVGVLGVVLPETLQMSAVGPIDFDGGELSGTGDGRLFAFAGKDPAKLVEYDKKTAAALNVTPLVGLETTDASAFAFYGGDIYFFTEAPPTDCAPCLEANCPQDYAACLTDPVCAEALACALGSGDITDECGGLMPAELQACLAGTCLAECLPSPKQRVSQVTRLDLDGSEGAGQTLTILPGKAPARIVGAGASPCVPVSVE